MWKSLSCGCWQRRWLLNRKRASPCYLEGSFQMQRILYSVGDKTLCCFNNTGKNISLNLSITSFYIKKYYLNYRLLLLFTKHLDKLSFTMTVSCPWLGQFRQFLIVQEGANNYIICFYMQIFPTDKNSLKRGKFLPQLFRLLYGFIMDKTTYKIAMSLEAICLTVLVASLPLTSYIGTGCTSNSNISSIEV